MRGAFGMRTRAGLMAACCVAVLVGCGEAKEDRHRLDRIAEVYTQGDRDAAMAQLEDYVRVYPEDWLAWTIMGHIHEDRGEDEAAREVYERALSIRPDSVQALTGMGILARKTQAYDEAMDYYKRAVAIEPGYAQAYASMMVISLKRNDDEGAVEFGRKAYELDPTDPVIAANLSVALHYAGLNRERDEMFGVAEELGYGRTQALEEIFSGELTVRD